MPKVALVQMACGPESAENVRRAVGYIEEAADRGAEIICLQEMFAHQFFPQYFDKKHFALAEPIDGPTVERMRRVARTVGRILVVPFYEQEAPGVYYNTAVVIDERGEVIGKYRKSHIPFGDLYWEKYYFKPGNLGYPVFRTRHGTIGIYICYDRHFPEGARLLGLPGAQPVLIPIATSRKAAREVFEIELRAMAIANQYFVGGVNRVGVEGANAFFGNSLFCSPTGEVIARAGTEKDEVLVADLDFAKVTEARNNWLFYRDRRPETYGDLAEPGP